MSLKEMYYYLFFTYYRLFEAFKTTRWLTDTKAIIVVSSLEIWIVFSLNFYSEFLFHYRGQLNFISFKVLVPFILILITKWFAFGRDDKWKEYVKEFDQWPKEKKTKGSLIVAGITLFIFANLLFSLYLDPPPNGWKQ